MRQREPPDMRRGPMGQSSSVPLRKERSAPRRWRTLAACGALAATAAVAGGCMSSGSSGSVTAGGKGCDPAAADTLRLTPAEVAKLRSMHATAALVMHFSGDTWSNAQVAALRAEFARLGIRVVAHTDAQAKAAKQFSDIES